MSDVVFLLYSLRVYVCNYKYEFHEIFVYFFLFLNDLKIHLKFVMIIKQLILLLLLLLLTTFVTDSILMNYRT